VSIIKRDFAVYGFDGAANFAAATYANIAIGGLQLAAYDNIVVDSNAAVNGLGAVDFGPVIDLYAAIHCLDAGRAGVAADVDAAVDRRHFSDLLAGSDANAAIHFAYLSKLFGMTIVSEQIAREQKR